MTTRSLSVVLFNVAEAEWLVEKAGDVALALDSHLIGLHPFSPVIWASGLGGEPVYFASMLDWEEKESAKLKTRFDQMLGKNGLNGEYRAQTDLYGAEPFLMSGCRGADAVILGATGKHSPDGRLLAQRVVREAGRPVLVLGSNSRVRGLVRKAVVGWTDTREATRAAHDALAFLAPGAEITLVSFYTRASSLPQGLSGRDDFAAALNRAGYRVDVSDQLASSDDLPAALSRFAVGQGAELLVTGAFGHSQVYDLLVGAVTRDLMEDVNLPVLLSR